MVLLKSFNAMVAVFACVVLAAYFGQRKLMYYPDPTRTAPAAAGFPAAEEVVLPTPDGEKLVVWHVPPKGNRPVVLYLHGNGDALLVRVNRFRSFVADGTSLVAVVYRGLSGSTGSPTEQGLIIDAIA